MDKNKKKVVTIIVIILVVISILTIGLSYLLPINNKEKPSTNPNENSPIEEIINKEITLLEDENKFFGVQKVIDNYYDLLLSNNYESIYNLLEKNYLIENNINKSNISAKLKHNYMVPTYTAKKIFYNANSSITYYFVNGYFRNTHIGTGETNYEKNINYLIIVNNANRYVIKPLSKNIDIESFAKSYKILKVDIENSSSFNSKEMDLKNKLTIYINQFMDLMFMDTERAYNMLDDDTKKKYVGYSDFENHIVDIYEKYSTKIFSYASKQIDGTTKYTIIDDKQNTIKITEYNIMDYKIGF